MICEKVVITCEENSCGVDSMGGKFVAFKENNRLNAHKKSLF